MGAPPAPPGQLAYAMAQWVLPSQDEQLGLPNGRSSARGSSRTQMESWEIPQSCHCHGDHRWIYTWSKMLNWDLTSRICSVYQFSSTCGSNPNILYGIYAESNKRAGPSALVLYRKIHLGCSQNQESHGQCPACSSANVKTNHQQPAL